MAPKCTSLQCNKNGMVKWSKTGKPLCKECFCNAFENEVHTTIIENKLFVRGSKVAIAASGGKDSTVLIHVLDLLNKKHDYGLNLHLVSIDEGITGYRDDSLATVEQNKKDYNIELEVLSYEELYKWPMDKIVQQVGRKNNCTFCGVFRRQALDRGAQKIGADCLVTGHNADDIAETVLMNMLRGDVARLSRCTNIVTMGDDCIPRCKPLKYSYEKEIVMYAFHKKLLYFSTECTYSPEAYRGHIRSYLKNLERIKPTAIIDIIKSGEKMALNDNIQLPKRGICTRCKFVSSQPICKACTLLEGLNRGLPKLGIGKSNHAKKIMNIDKNLI